MIDSFTGEYRFLSNFYPATVLYDRIAYDTSEHAYQAAKTHNRGLKKAIAQAKTPGKAKAMGARIVKDKTELRPDWFDVNIGIMKDIVRIKFTSNSELAEMLLETGDEELVEGNTWGDSFWGVSNGVGENHLGRILMEVRSELRYER